MPNQVGGIRGFNVKTIRNSFLALMTVGLVMSAGAAGFTKAAKVKAATTPSRCAAIDEGLDSAIANGPQTGAGHQALIDAEITTLHNTGCPGDQALTTTVSSDSVTVGQAIHDTARLSGAFNPTGQIGFTVWQVAEGHTCLNSGPGTPVPPPANVHGNGNYTSATFTPTHAGTYAFGAFYTGDGTNPQAASACEPFTVVSGS